MQIFIKIWDKLKRPKPLWLTLFYIFFVVLISGTLTLVVLQPEQTVFHYILYVLAAGVVTSKG